MLTCLFCQLYVTGECSEVFTPRMNQKKIARNFFNIDFFSENFIIER